MVIVDVVVDVYVLEDVLVLVLVPPAQRTKARRIHPTGLLIFSSMSHHIGPAP
jgi:hypothetical protein